MTHQSFLGRVAQVYTSGSLDELAETCFILPNKRSMAFLMQHIESQLRGRSYILPAITDISGFVASFSDLAEATRYEMLFTLFNCYAKLNPEISTSFDKFIFWGEMLVSDFNDVDRYLVDPDKLFTNLERLKEIGSNYLTEEQIEIIRRYWDNEMPDAEPETFWRHALNSGEIAGGRFVKLWEVLAPLYHSYIDALASRGLTTSGALYRNAAEAIRRKAASTLTFSKYVFVGFNVLTTSELQIFRRLKALGKAEFYWDFNSPELLQEDNKAGRFIRKNKEEFPSPATFVDEPLTSVPDIRIIGIPSSVGQVKMAGATLDHWHSDGIIHTEKDNINTAVVLPDESLFIPLIHSIPPSISEMNVTMGFPMRLSPIAALMSSISHLQRNARRKDGNITGYYYDDVRSLLSMPLVYSIDPDGARDIGTAIQSRRLFTVAPEVIMEFSPTLFPIFAPISRKESPASIADKLIAIVDFLMSHLGDTDRLQHHFLESYRSSVATLFSAIETFGADMDAFTFIHLVDRTIKGDTVNFVGEPLKGVQIMGMLETRALDFSNILVMSMNERIFPRKQYTRSFIPDILRKAYGMATTDFQESIFAYYFYRLIARAKNVTLLYDSRTVGGTRSSEMSRYISQLIYLRNGKNITHIQASFPQPLFNYEATSVAKTPAIMEKLQRFTTPNSGFNLSASSINTYINCPLQFYLQYVERFNTENELVDYVDSSTYGSIVHQVLENLYSSLPLRDSHRQMTADMIHIITRPDYPLIDWLIVEAINNHYHNIHIPSAYKPLVGETSILGNIIHTNVTDVLLAEIPLTPFSFIGAEKRLDGRMEINDDLTINIRQIIDRIDMITDTDGLPTLRIVDYKTGSDPLSASSVEALFNSASAARPKAMMQLMFYCYFYSQSCNYSERIQPIIYSMRSIPAKGITPLTLCRKPLLDYREYIDEFLTRFKSTVEEIFNPDIPFTTARSEHSCTFCNFKPICSRDK